MRHMAVKLGLQLLPNVRIGLLTNVHIIILLFLCV